MPSPVPTPVAAALGVVPAVLSGVRKLPAKAVQLPVLAVSSALTALDGFRQEYDDLAERGERLIARLRGISFDEVEDRVEDAVAGLPLAGPSLAGAYDRVEDAVEAALDRASSVSRQRSIKATSPAGRLAPDETAPKGAPTPKARQPDASRVDTAATPAVVAVVEQVVEASSNAIDHDTHEDLPLEDYDHLTLGSLRGRLRSLDVDQLVRLRGYEKAHADRLPVVTMLDNRIAKLATDAAAAPSPGGELPPTAKSSAGGRTAAAKKRSPRATVRTT